MAKFQIKGLHLNIKKVYANGRTAYRHYHRRGKGAVCIGETAQRLCGVLPRDMVERALAASKAERTPTAPIQTHTKSTLSQLFAEWQGSAEYRKNVKSPSTRRLHDDNIEKWCAGGYVNQKGSRKRFGDMPLALFQEDWAKDKFLSFRDQRSTAWRPVQVSEAQANAARRGADFPMQPRIGDYWIQTGGKRPLGFQFRETPKAADHLVIVLAACLAWAKRRGKIKINLMEGVEKLYRANRSAIIWTSDDLLKLKVGEAASPPHQISQHLWDVVCLAALTGLAQADLLRLTWGMVLAEWIDLEGGRKKTGVDAMPPILPETRELLERIRREQGGHPHAAATVLLSSRGEPWTGDGFRSSWHTAKTRAGIGRGLHFHDLRGTAATMFASSEARYSDLQIDLFMGWTEGESAGIRRKYVNARNVAKGLRALLEGETKPPLVAVVSGSAVN